jgi:hypothetical protein
VAPHERDIAEVGGQREAMDGLLLGDAKVLTGNLQPGDRPLELGRPLAH